jgi:hypothetical protein
MNRGSTLWLLIGALSACNPGLSHDDQIEQQTSPAPPLAPGLLRYYGGAVLTSVTIVEVDWNRDVASGTVATPFYRDIVDSDYLAWLSEYDGDHQHIGHGAFVGAFTLDQPTMPLIKASDMEDAIAGAVATGALPQPDANTLYMMHFPARSAISDNLNIQTCGFHRSGGTRINGVYPRYAAISPSGCSYQLTETMAHELAEAITDPDNSGFGLTDIIGWYAERGGYPGVGGEIADLCQFDPDGDTGIVTVHGASYSVAKLYDNATGECVLVRHIPDPCAGVNCGGGYCANGGCYCDPPYDWRNGWCVLPPKICHCGGVSPHCYTCPVVAAED